MPIYNYVQIELLVQKCMFLRFMQTTSILLVTVKVLNWKLTQIYFEN